MSITIHYDVQLTGEAAYRAVAAEISAMAAEQGWYVQMVDAEELELAFEEPCPQSGETRDRIYRGRVRGFIIEIDPGCEHMQLLFDASWRCQDFVKTQFAPIDCHIDIVRLLRKIEAAGAVVRIDDDGGFWETADIAALASARSINDLALSEARETGDFYVPFAIGGRILDMVPRTAVEVALH